MQKLYAQIRETVDGWQMLPLAPAPVLLMVSGGSDSVAMTRLLTELYPDRAYTILHINHGLRGAAAEADEAFVCELARELGLPCQTRRFDLAAIQLDRGGNIEELGRELRYATAGELLVELESEAGVATTGEGRILTAHTANDQAETFMMRIMKGAGSEALAGIMHKRSQIVRPMLDCMRQDLRTWLIEQGHLWCEDATNNDTRYLRAFVRHELLPLMQVRNPRLIETIKRNQQILSGENDYIEHSLQTWAESGNLGLPEHPALARRWLRLAYSQAGGDVSDLTFEHIENLRNNWQTVGFVVDLPGGIRVRSRGNGEALEFSKQPTGTTETNLSDSAGFSAQLFENTPLHAPLGTISFTQINPELFREDPVGYARMHADNTHIIVDMDVLETSGEPLIISPLRQGERFSPLGMNGHQKLVSDLLIDKKVPKEQRPHLLKLAVGTQIVWVIGVQADDRFKARPESKRLSSIIIGSNNG